MAARRRRFPLTIHPRAQRSHRLRLLLLVGLAVVALAFFAIPVLSSHGGGASASVQAGASASAPGHDNSSIGAGSASPAPPLRVPVRVTPAPAPPGPVPHAQYQEIHANCKVTRHLSDDPIVSPGLPGNSHNHTFIGNTTTDAYSTVDTLLAGSSSCEDTKDTSAYWFPTLYQNGKVVDPSTATVYYKSGVKDYRTVIPFPANFRLLVGSMLTPDAAHFKGDWQCTGYKGNDFPASCPPGSALIVHLKAPSCWDGLNLDSPDHKSHMAYPVNDACPADHPVALPMLEAKVAYKLPGGVTTGLRYSSGASYSFHFDFFSAWQPDRLAYLVKHCINEGRQCNGYGVDQHKP